MADPVLAEIQAYLALQNQASGSILQEAGFSIFCASTVMPPNNQVTRSFGQYIAGSSARAALDIGCGTGILALIAARRCAAVIGVDINPQAVACSQMNALRNNISNVHFCLGDAYEPLLGQRFDLIFSNPPFYPVGAGEAAGAELCAVQSNGLLEKIIMGANAHLAPGGRVLFVTSSLSHNTAIAALLDQLMYFYTRQLLHAGIGKSQDIFLWEFRGKA